MHIRLTYFLAFRFLNPREVSKFISFTTVLSILGITIGVATLTAILSIFDGYRKNLETILLSTTPHILIKKSTIDHDLLEGDMDDPFGDEFFNEQSSMTNNKRDDLYMKEYFTRSEIDKMNNFLWEFSQIVAIQPVIKETVSLTWSRNANGENRQILEVTIYGNDFPEGETATHLSRMMSDRDVLKDFAHSETHKILLSSDLSHMLSGQGLIWIWPNREIQAENISPVEFEETGQLQIGLSQDRLFLAVTSLAGARKILRKTGSANFLYIKLKDGEKAKKVRNAISQHLPKGYYAIDWQTASKKVFRVLNILKFIIFITLFLIIITSALSIKTTLTMIVLQKTKQISILKALGIERDQVQRIFVCTSLLIGFAGTALGIILGFAIAWVVGFFQSVWLAKLLGLTSVDLHFDLITFATITFAIVVISLIASIGPARRAASIDPVIGLGE